MLFPFVRRQFAAQIEREDHEIDLALASLLIAREEYPTLQPAAYLSHLDRLALRVRQRSISASSVREVIDALGEVLFVEEGFRGNAQSYYDPRNSFLNDVIDRKLGIPITLSVVYMAVGIRLGLPVVGIGLPGHFIVAVQGTERILVDPFHEGTVLSLDDCADRVRQVYGDRLAFHPRMLEPVTNRQILTRMLNNLKVVYAHADDFGRLLAVIDRLLLINPGEVSALRDRGAVCQQVRFYGQALADLGRYLDLAPRAADADQVRRAVKSIQRSLSWQN